jgi:sterol desaturase/sphingolipid hydroxylase (fatty acid hydroxylase superfamily)
MNSTSITTKLLEAPTLIVHAMASTSAFLKFTEAIHFSASSVSLASHGVVPLWLSKALIMTVLRLIGYGIFYVSVTELQYKTLDWLHKKGILERFQKEPLPENRDFAYVLFAMTSVTLPMSAFMSFNEERLFSKMVFEIDVWEILWLQTLMYVLVDTWYYWGHRYMHKNKWFWNNVHAVHHEKKNITVYATGYAAWIENFLLIAPEFVIVLAVMDKLSSTRFNMLAFQACLISQMIVFNLGHCGYFFHPIMWLMGPPNAHIQQLPKLIGSGYSENPEDHEMHHLYPMCNFGLNFTFWDKMMGSYKPITDLIRNKKEL